MGRLPLLACRMRIAAAFLVALSLAAALFASPTPAQSRAADVPPDPAAIQRRSEAAADTPDKADALAERAKLLWQTDQDAALRYARDGLALAERLGYDRGRAANLNAIGVVHYLRGAYDVARPALAQSIALYQAAGDAKNAGRTASNLAHLEAATNAYDEARRGYDRAEALGRQANDDAGIATAKDGLGNLLQAQGRYREAIAAFTLSLEHAERAGDERSRAITLNNLANCQLEAGDTRGALAGYLEAAERFEKLDLPLFQAQAYANLAPILQDQGMADRARVYLERALAIQRKAGQRPAEGVTLLNLGVLLADVGDTAGATAAYLEARALFRKIGDGRNEALALHNLGRVQIELGQPRQAVRDLTQAVALREAVPDPRGALSSRVALGLALTAADRAREAVPLVRAALVEAKRIGVAELEAEAESTLADALRALGQYREAYEHQARFIELRGKLLSESSQERIAEMQARFESERAERAIEVLKRDGEIQSLELQRQALLRNALIGSVLVLLVAAAAIASRYRIKTRSEAALRDKNVQLEHARGELQVERDKSEKLLLNVLPPAIAGRLKDDAATIADHHPETTVLFADIVGFTQLAQTMDADALLRLLNDLFTRFDALTDGLGLEKIKTIGDCYMAVGGAPAPRADHCEAVAELALGLLDEVGRFNEEQGRALALRIGMHSGEVVAGVIGRRKFAYDLWGDAVNTASRMESHGEPGRIHVTEAVASRLAGRYRFEPRGEIEVKGKGPMRTYFLTGRIDPAA